MASSGAFIVNFEHVLHFVPVFLLLTLSRLGYCRVNQVTELM